MKAIVQARYGSPDVLQFTDIGTPVLKDEDVLVRVHAAAVNIGDWHLLRGVPYGMRVVTGLQKPRREIPGLDIAGQVESVGSNVRQLQAGDEVFGWCKGAFGRVRVSWGEHPPAQASQPHVRASGGRWRLRVHRVGCRS
jgi:NADPH:quinone reductase-like Zn-dependent oxidoreductase